MDPHPTPFPGKLRPSANAKKEKGEAKSSREPGRLTALPSRHRQNRVFGTVRSTNVTVERPPQEQFKAFKQSKPSGTTSKKLPSKAGSKTEPKKEPAGASLEDAKDAARKPKSEPRKTIVRFQDQQKPAEKDSSKGVLPEEGPQTPVSSIKPTVLLGTPYYSAKSCSKCRFDRLESAPYWLTQVKLAESVGKHFVSAAFFRLALECNAEPIRSLKSELKRYIARHNSLRLLAVWKEVCHAYGLLDEELSLGVTGFFPDAASLLEKPQQGISGDCNDGCSGFGFGGVPQSDLSKEATGHADYSFVELSSNIGENPVATAIGGISQSDLSKEDSTKTADSSSVEPNSSVGDSPSAAVIGEGANEGVNEPPVNVLEDNLMKDGTDDSNVVNHCNNEGSSMVATPGENFLLEKSERSCSLSPNDFSSMRKKVQPHDLVSRSKITSSKSQEASESRGEGTGKSKDEAKRNQKSKEDAKKNQKSRLKSPRWT